jgi:hypothetical protein
MTDPHTEDLSIRAAGQKLLCGYKTLFRNLKFTSFNVNRHNLAIVLHSNQRWR